MKQGYTVKLFEPSTGRTYTLSMDGIFYAATARPRVDNSVREARTSFNVDAHKSYISKSSFVYVEGPRKAVYPIQRN